MEWNEENEAFLSLSVSKINALAVLVVPHSAPGYYLLVS
jgi:hypothetical protein